MKEQLSISPLMNHGFLKVNASFIEEKLCCLNFILDSFVTTVVFAVLMWSELIKEWHFLALKSVLTMIIRQQ